MTHPDRNKFCMVPVSTKKSMIAKSTITAWEDDDDDAELMPVQEYTLKLTTPQERVFLGCFTSQENPEIKLDHQVLRRVPIIAEPRITFFALEIKGSLRQRMKPEFLLFFQTTAVESTYNYVDAGKFSWTRPTISQSRSMSVLSRECDCCKNGNPNGHVTFTDEISNQKLNNLTFAEQNATSVDVTYQAVLEDFDIKLDHFFTPSFSVLDACHREIEDAQRKIESEILVKDEKEEIDEKKDEENKVLVSLKHKKKKSKKQTSKSPRYPPGLNIRMNKRKWKFSNWNDLIKEEVSQHIDVFWETPEGETTEVTEGYTELYDVPEFTKNK